MPPDFYPLKITHIQVGWDKVAEVLESKSTNSVRVRYGNAKRKAKENGMEAAPDEPGTAKKPSTPRRKKATAQAESADGDDAAGSPAADADGNPAAKKRKRATPKAKSAVKVEDDEGNADVDGANGINGATAATPLAEESPAKAPRNRTPKAKAAAATAEGEYGSPIAEKKKRASKKKKSEATIAVINDENDLSLDEDIMMSDERIEEFINYDG
jgi:hypothetical protein